MSTENRLKIDDAFFEQELSGRLNADFEAQGISVSEALIARTLEAVKNSPENETAEPKKAEGKTRRNIRTMMYSFATLAAACLVVVIGIRFFGSGMAMEESAVLPKTAMDTSEMCTVQSESDYSPAAGSGEEPDDKEPKETAEAAYEYEWYCNYDADGIAVTLAEDGESAELLKALDSARQTADLPVNGSMNYCFSELAYAGVVFDTDTAAGVHNLLVSGLTIEDALPEEAMNDAAEEPEECYYIICLTAEGAIEAYRIFSDGSIGYSVYEGEVWSEETAYPGNGSGFLTELDGLLTTAAQQ